MAVDPWAPSEGERSIEVAGAVIDIPWWIILLALAGVAVALGTIIISETSKPKP